MKEIVALIVDNLTAREILRDCQGAHGFTATTASADQEIDTWSSRTLFAIEDTRVHDLWLEVTTKPANKDVLQTLLDGRIGEDDGRLSELAQTLKYVSSAESFRIHAYTLDTEILNRHISLLDISSVQKSLQAKLRSFVVHQQIHRNQMHNRFLVLRICLQCRASSTKRTIQRICYLQSLILQSKQATLVTKPFLRNYSKSQSHRRSCSNTC